MKIHYHVMLAFPGCLPEINEVYTNKKDAMQLASTLAREYRQDGYKVYGTRDTGYQAIRDSKTGSGINIEFCKCSDMGCLEY